MLALESQAEPALTRPYPLDDLVAQTRGMIGYWLAQSLRDAAVTRPIISLITQTVTDPAFARPARFVGPGYPLAEAFAASSTDDAIRPPVSGDLDLATLAVFSQCRRAAPPRCRQVRVFRPFLPPRSTSTLCRDGPVGVTRRGQRHHNDQEIDMTAHAADSTDRIIAGVDGSPGSKNALKWAMNQAHLTGATVEAVTTWQDPTQYGSAYGWTAVAFDGGTYASVMAKVLNDAIAEVTARTPHPVTVLAQVVEGHPAEALLHAATGARLLVVGSRGHGTFAGMLLGSVSQHCVQHAPCPVVVVP